jgi:hypothetical protein
MEVLDSESQGTEDAEERMPRLHGLSTEQTKGPVNVREHSRSEGISGHVS